MYSQLYTSSLYLALIVGVVLSLIYVEITGVLPAGLIVPGYLALIFDQPVFIVMLLFISLLTYLVVTRGIARVTILYGRRKFAAMLLTAIVLKLALLYFYPVIPFEIFELRGVGVIVPGLVANTIERQGLAHTLGSSLLLGGLTFIIVFALKLI